MYKKITSGLITLFSKIKAFFSKPNTELTASLSGNDNQSKQYNQPNNSGSIHNGDTNYYGENKEIGVAKEKAKLIAFETEIYQRVKLRPLSTEDRVTAVKKEVDDLKYKVTSIISLLEKMNGQYLSESLKTAISNCHIAVEKFLYYQKAYTRSVKNAGNIDSQTQINIVNRLENAKNEFEEAYDYLNKLTN